MSAPLALSRCSPKRRMKDRLFGVLCLLSTAAAGLLLLAMLWRILGDGAKRISWNFVVSMASHWPDRTGVLPALLGSLEIMILTALFSVPVGVAAAVYLEEFQTKPSKLRNLIQANLSNLAGVPSIVFGLLGLVVFVRWMALDRGVLSGALTMTLLVLPVVIVVSQEALRAVPHSYREGSLALGATRWQTIRGQVLPAARGGILSGIILSLSRAIGETAPLIVVGAAGYVSSLPRNPIAWPPSHAWTNVKSLATDGYTVLPLQIYDWSTRPQTGFHEAAAAAICVLVVSLLIMNSVAIVLRSRAMQR